MIDIYLKGILLVILLFCSYRDLKERRIPNEYLLRGACIRVLLLLSEVATEGSGAIRSLFLKTIFCILFIGLGILLQKMTREGIGMGDMKLMALMLFYLDVDVWFDSILWAMGFGLIALLFIKPEKKEERRIPFAPALTLGLVSCIVIEIM